MSEIKKRLECILMPEYFVKDRRGGKRVVDAVAPELERLEDQTRTQDQILAMQADALDKLESVIEEQNGRLAAHDQGILEFLRRIADLESRLGDNF